ncbi:MAG TPA: translation elongation factor Ts [Sphingomonadales bacterium]|nr:translation elongation factor Ts [Sphingomonadales bacterium]
MAEITASMVKELREKTGAGMMDCKKALAEAKGDLEGAVDWLRKKGLSAAAKKSSRVAAEGLIGIAAGGNMGVITEVNAETDFVSRNEQFQDFVKTVTELGLANEGDLQAVLESGYPGTERTVAEQLTHNIATIGENMTLRRMTAVSVEQGLIASYLHNKVSPELGKIGVMVALESAAPKTALEALGRELAMHIAAAKPLAIRAEDIDAGTVAREKAIFTDQAKQSGKPAAIIEKMVEGKLRKFYEEAALLQQVSILDNETRIEKVIAEAAKAAGKPIAVSAFVRFALGEGIEKGGSDFAAEVKQAAGL